MAKGRAPPSSASDSESSSIRPKIKRDADSSNSSEGDISPRKLSPQKRKLNKSSTSRQSDHFARFRNTEMITKYKAKNPHISVQSSNLSSQFVAEELSSDDEVWLFQAPASLDVTQLVGQSLKLGSRNSTVSVSNEKIECVSEKYDDPKAMAIICPQRNAQLSLVSFNPAGRVLLRSNINDENEEAISFDELTSTVKVPFPANLKVRHPLHGIDFEKKIKVDPDVKSKLQDAQIASLKKPRAKKIKRETVDEDADVRMDVTPDTSPKKKTKKRKLEVDNGNDDDDIPFLPKKIRTQIDGDDENDLDWIKQL